MAKFSVDMLQEFDGSERVYSPDSLVGAPGQVVNYHILIANTGDMDLTFPPVEARCEDLSLVTSATILPPGEWIVETCKHVLSGQGTWMNYATVTATPATGVPMVRRSNTTSARSEESDLRAEVLQRVAGEGSYRSDNLAAEPEAVIEYEVQVTNLARRIRDVSAFVDPDCYHITGGPPNGALAAGETAIYECERIFTGFEVLVNQATIEVTNPRATIVSNRVLADG